MSKSDGKMPKIKVVRCGDGYTEGAVPGGRLWAGYLEPESKSWILWIANDEHNTPSFFGHRDPETGATLEPPISVFVNGQDIRARHVMGSTVRVCFDADAEPAQFILGHVCGVSFTDGGKVLYDVATMVPDPTNRTPGGYSYIRQVDSCFVEPDPGP